MQFPTLCWYEVDYSVFVTRQATRRSWRIGQPQPVKVVFMAYRNTLQADALTLVAKKLQASLAVEGELPSDGLAAFGDDGDDLMLALARKIVAGEEDAGSLESVFEQARQVAAEAEALLVDEGWHAPQPAIAEAEALTVAAGADERRDEAGEPQRLLFSWAEFMAGEPAVPKPQRRREAPTLSLFEWALERETGRRARGSGVVDEGAGDIAAVAMSPAHRPCVRPFVVPAGCDSHRLRAAVEPDQREAE